MNLVILTKTRKQKKKKKTLKKLVEKEELYKYEIMSLTHTNLIVISITFKIYNTYRKLFNYNECI